MAQRSGIPSEKDGHFEDIDGKEPHALTTGYSRHSDSSKSQGEAIPQRAPIIETGIPSYIAEEDHFGEAEVVSTASDLVTHVLHVDDDPTLNPWTFRTWFLGIGLSLFGSILATIYYFKPQTIFVSVIFLAVISYVLGEVLAAILPRRGWIGKILNPHPFNVKEHAAIVLMSSAAATCALGVEVLAVQRLWYNYTPEPVAAIFMLIASQLLGFGIAGLMRRTLTYPTKMLFPINLPINTMLETLHRDKKETSQRLKVFYIAFGILFIWEVFPQYIMTVVGGISVFCLAKQDSLVFTNLFGGSNGNEGLGLLSLCLDWQYIAATISPLWYPLQTLFSNFIGYILCIVVFVAVYYNNIWEAQNFPFLSQLLFSNNSNSTLYDTYNQTAILNEHNELDQKALQALGLPYLSATNVVYIISTNLAITATLTHMLLWNYKDISTAWEFMRPENLKKLGSLETWKFWKGSSDQQIIDDLANPDLDPHYKLLLQYKQVPGWWFGILLILATVIGLGTLYAVESTLPWWGFLIACALSAICILFFGAQYGITGFQFIIQPIIQMIGGYLHPGMPVANMYFTLFGFNSVQQGQLLLKDFKLAQFAHLSPRCTFTMQMFGTVIGAIFNYIMMTIITTEQREILLSVEGTNIWSGQMVQTYNTQAIAWSLAKYMFSIGGRYQWVTLAFLLGFAVPVPLYILQRAFPKLRFWYLNTAIITYYIGFLSVGVNSSIGMFFVVGFFTQFFLRRYRPKLFVKYNYLMAAAMDGGTQVVVFILTFAVQGGSGNPVPFPKYWGNNVGGNNDYCMLNPANGGS